ncbi:MAG: S-layer homology domain-containing protein [Lachnospiraceae bacterium]
MGKKRMIAAMMAAVFTVLQIGNCMPVLQTEAASKVNISAENLLVDPGFEDTSADFVPHNGEPKISYWSNYLDSTKKANHDAYSGEWAVELGRTACAIEQDSDRLQIGESYVATVWAKATNPSGTSAYFGIKNYGGQEIKVKITSDEYELYEIPFTYTGASGGNYPRIYVWVESMSSGAVYADDFTLTANSDLEEMSIENGRLSVTYREGYSSVPSKDDFRAVYSTSLNESEKKEIVFTGEKISGNRLELTFDPVAAAPLEQVITADVTYLPKGQTLTLDYTVEGNGEDVVIANVASFTAENGLATVVLDEDPTLTPVLSDFEVWQSVNGSEYEVVNIREAVYDRETQTAVLQLPKVNVKAETQDVVLKLTYNGQEYETEFVVEIGDGVIYYVDASNGDDNNDGHSPETAIQTIDKVNTIEFQPGDQLLFKCGEEWTGALKPQGSGIEGAPIIISSYGGGEKPVLKPGEGWRIPYFNVANSVVWNPTVNNVITFYNQEYWEVSDLELYDPTYAQNASTRVYRRGINISAEDVGDLYHFTFDNLTIHGFRGPNDNNGKSSGGIIMTVYSDPFNRANRVPTAVHDITVTNCEMYDLGRSGFNFVSPWTTRTGSEWGAFGYAGYGDWKPYENITIKNNTVYNIDGDGILIDGCKNVLVEHNVVYRALINCWYGVGMFNWNSDNTVFQFNEVYDTFPADSLLGAGDGQGIEIDALNRDTYVQYNYIHDNSGGSIMWCATDNLRTIRGIYRYNIFQNDLTKHGIIDWRTNHKESMAYNNVFYLGKLPEGSTTRRFMNNGYTGNSDAKFYNNIFYNLDEIELNTFNEQEIDWESNIFFGFDEVPSNDSTVITEDPKFADPGKGAYGIDTLDGYRLQEDSPAIDAGVNIENNGGRDYFGTPLTDGKTDIGAAEYTVSPTPVENPFTDVTTDDYFYDAVLWALERNITDGWTTTEFAPDMTCSRGQIVTFLWRANGCQKAESASEFTDVAADAYYADAVAWAVEEKITNGWTDTEFAPDRGCTRGQCVTFLYAAENK